MENKRTKKDEISSFYFQAAIKVFKKVCYCPSTGITSGKLSLKSNYCWVVKIIFVILLFEYFQDISCYFV